MHELSLCRSIYGIVDGARNGREVEVVRLQIGQLRQVVPDTLTFCWDLVTQDGPLAGSRLQIDHIPVRLTCHDCGAETTITQVLILTCGSCHGARIGVLSGEEMLVTSLDLGPAATAAPTSP